VPDRRGSRFVLEVFFLLALAVGLTLASLNALEWAAWRSEPHYGSGLPPRYYVPRVNLPPAQPLDPVATGYPEAVREEAPTWIASAALRQEMLGEWPVAIPADEPDHEAIEVVGAVVDPWLVAELPAAPLGEREPEAEPEPTIVEPPLEPPPLELPPVEALPVETLPELEPERESEPEPLVAATEQVVVEPEPVVELAHSVQGVARYSLDPLADAPARRRFGRGGGEAPLTVEVPARPAGARPLPGRSARQD
jgi:hypothetical protein